MIVLFARAQTQTPGFRRSDSLVELAAGFCGFLPPSPAGRFCKQLPGQRPVGWGQFQNASLSPARHHSARAPNEPGAGAAHTERPHLQTRLSAGQREAAVWTRWLEKELGFDAGQLTFGAIEFVTTYRHQINFPVRDVDGNLSNSLCSIGVEENSFRTTNPTCGIKGKRLSGSSFHQQTKSECFKNPTSA